jgi:hypothetical protein
MWNLYQKAKLYRTPPSDLINLHEFCESITGLPGPDEWTAWAFDSAVEWLGSFIENKLHQLDDKRKPIYQLADLLAERKSTTPKANEVVGVFGGDLISLEALLQDERYIEQIRSGKVKPPPGYETKEIM